MLQVSYDPALVAASVLVGILGSFTGLRLASGLGALDPAARKRQIGKAAIALGGGIWSMHFLGMLAVRLPVPIAYEALATLGSLLVAILVTGLGLLVLHFGARTRARIALAGALTGLGIVAMHYIGMSAIGGNCTVGYHPAGYPLAGALAIAASTLAIWLAYTRRSLRQLALGAVVLGLAISAMHYTAMVFTYFHRADRVVLLPEPTLSSGVLALVVAFASFVICGLFLLSAVPPLAEPAGPRSPATGSTTAEPAPAAVGAAASPAPASTAPASTAPAYSPERMAGGQSETSAEGLAELASRLPYEVSKATRFVPADELFAVRAQGHYSRLYSDQGELFCPWPISRVESALDGAPFVRTHRSYLVNMRHVQGFERTGDRAFCLCGKEADVRVPVSRSRVAEVRRTLGLA